LFKNKLLNIMLSILIVLTLMGGVAFTVIWYLKKDVGAEKVVTIDDIISYSVDIEEITTNLKDNGFIVISLKIQTNSEDAKVELEKRSFQVNNIVIQELATKMANDLKSKEGLLAMEDLLKAKINERMQDGTVEKVYITNRIIQ
jgi:flagellar FliL protein